MFQYFLKLINEVLNKIKYYLLGNEEFAENYVVDEVSDINNNNDNNNLSIQSSQEIPTKQPFNDFQLNNNVEPNSSEIEKVKAAASKLLNDLNEVKIFGKISQTQEAQDIIQALKQLEKNKYIFNLKILQEFFDRSFKPKINRADLVGPIKDFCASCRDIAADVASKEDPNYDVFHPTLDNLKYSAQQQKVNDIESYNNFCSQQRKIVETLLCSYKKNKSKREDLQPLVTYLYDQIIIKSQEMIDKFESDEDVKNLINDNLANTYYKIVKFQTNESGYKLYNTKFSVIHEHESISNQTKELSQIAVRYFDRINNESFARQEQRRDLAKFIKGEEIEIV